MGRFVYNRPCADFIASVFQFDKTTNKIKARCASVKFGCTPEFYIVSSIRKLFLRFYRILLVRRISRFERSTSTA
jgi:hypothetical protein